MTTLHMETDTVRAMASQLKQVAETLRSQTQLLNTSAQSADWLGPSRDEFVMETEGIVRQLESQAESGIALAGRVENEVTEWEGTSSSFGSAQFTIDLDKLRIGPGGIFPRPNPIILPDDPFAPRPDPIIFPDDPFAPKPDPIIILPDDPFAPRPDPITLPDYPFEPKPDPIILPDVPFAPEPDPIILPDNPFAPKPDPIILPDNPFAPKPDPIILPDDPFAPESGFETLPQPISGDEDPGEVSLF